VASGRETIAPRPWARVAAAACENEMTGVVVGELQKRTAAL
jgi:hypothetical protein